jgi:hypothetical protein
MATSRLQPQHFVNIAALEKLARSILADASYVWRTELWLDPLEQAKLAGEKFEPHHERIVARELLKTSAKVDDMLASTLDLYQMYEESGAATADYDATARMLAGRKPLPLGDVWREAQAHIPGLIAERGFEPALFESLMDWAKQVGVSFDGPDITVDKEGILLTGAHPHRLLRDAVKQFPRVDGDTYVREGLLGSFAFEKEKGDVCTTDAFQALLAFAKHGAESYRARVRRTLTSGLVPYKTGVAPIVIVIVLVIIAIIAAIIIGVLCATRNLSTQVCDISLKILGAIITAGICYIAGTGTDDSFSCGLSSGGSDG